MGRLRACCSESSRGCVAALAEGRATVDALATEYDGRATVAKMNVDENPNVPGRFMIRGIPTMLIFKNGELADQIVGLAAKEEIAKKLDLQLDTVQ